MSGYQFGRDNILSDDERAESARKCINILMPVWLDKGHQWRDNDAKFFTNQHSYSNRISYNPGERELAWLRDLVERYDTN